MSAGAKPGEPTCGDFGGRLKDGRPCTRLAGWGVVSSYARAPQGRCKDHTDDKASKDQAVKDAFVEALLNRLDDTVEAIGRTLVVVDGDKKTVENYSPSTLWYWRRDDPAFNKEVEQALAVRDQIQTANIEGNMYGQIMRGEAAAALTIFWLVNRSKSGRWRNVQRVQHEEVTSDVARNLLARLLGVDEADLPEDLSDIAMMTN